MMIALHVFLLLAVATTCVSGTCMSSTIHVYYGYISNYMRYITGKSYLPSCKSSRYKNDAYYAVYYANLFKERMNRLIANYYSTRWIKYNGHCYVRSYGTSTWKDSRSICLKMGGDLVTIDSSSENYWLKKKFGSYNSWTGLTSTSRTSSLRWINNNRSPSYTYYKNRYSNVCPQKCVYIYQGYWYVNSCTNSRYFVCEKNSCKLVKRHEYICTFLNCP